MKPTFYFTVIIGFEVVCTCFLDSDGIAKTDAGILNPYIPEIGQAKVWYLDNEEDTGQ